MEGDKLKRLKQLLTWDLERIDFLMSRAGEIPQEDIPYSFLHQAWVFRKKQLEIVRDLITFGETEQLWPVFGHIKKDLHLLERGSEGTNYDSKQGQEKGRRPKES